MSKEDGLCKCVVCGKTKPLRYHADGHFGKFDVGICSRECFEKEFWDRYVKVKDNPNVVRIEGKHYFVEDETIDSEERFFRGFGGRKFRIKKFTGEVVETKNLWYQGDIPAEYREQLPDNAEFVKIVFSESNAFVLGETANDLEKGGLLFCTEESCSF